MKKGVVIRMKLYKYRSLDTWYDEKKKVVMSGIDYCADIINNYELYFPKREQLNESIRVKRNSN